MWQNTCELDHEIKKKEFSATFRIELSYEISSTKFHYWSIILILIDYIDPTLPTVHDKADRGLLLSLVLEVVAVLYPSLPDTRPPWRCSGTCRLLEAWSRRRSSPAAWGPVGTSCAPGQSTPRSWNSGRSGSARHSMTTSAGTLSGCCLPCSWSVTIYTLLSISCFCLRWGLFICQL